MAEPRIAAVVLAAGRGTRFGPEPKLLAELDGKPLVRHAVAAAMGSAARPVVVVLGAHAALIRRALVGLDVELTKNPDFADGLSTSLRAGLAALPDGTSAVIVLLADMPRISFKHIDALIEAYLNTEQRPSAVVPVAGGRRGNPVLLDLVLLSEELAVLSGDRGAGTMLADRNDVLEVTMEPSVAFDIDTPDALLSEPQESRLDRDAASRQRSEQ